MLATVRFSWGSVKSTTTLTKTISRATSAFGAYLAKENTFKIFQHAGGCRAVENPVIKQEPHLQSPGFVEHSVMNLRSQQRHHVQDAGALSGEGGDAKRHLRLVIGIVRWFLTACLNGRVLKRWP